MATYSAIIREYLFGDLTPEEYASYLNYIKGYEADDLWMEKALVRREPLLKAELRCKKCSSYIDIRVNGVCKCFNGHKCYKEVIAFIKTL